jgi:hypothetical protein
MFNPLTIANFNAHVLALRGDAARERAEHKAAELEARLERLERQTISVWRVQNGHPIEIIHRR